MKLRGRALAILAGSAALSIAVIGGAVAMKGSAADAAETLLSQGKPVTASSSAGCCPAKNVNDGSTSTRWASVANKDPSWIYIDLGATSTITHVKLFWDLSCAIAYQVQTSTDHVTWVNIFTTTTGKGGVNDLTGLNGTGRYVRMFGTKRCRADATHGYSLDEFQVFGGSGGSGPRPPNAPTASAVTATSITATWTDPTPDPATVAYQLFHDGQFCQQVSAPTKTATCSNLSPNQQYGLYVNSVDKAGNVGQPSPTTSITTPKLENIPPTVPTNVTMVPGSLTSTSVSLTWTASTDDTAVAGYNVYNGSIATKVGQSNGNTPSADIQGLSPGTTYHLVVTALDTSKNESAPSTPAVTFTTPSGGHCTTPFCGTQTIATDDDVVWGLVTLPDGTILFNERDAHDIIHLNPTTGAKHSIGTVPNVQSTDGEGGLTGLEINPVSFSSDHWLYIMHTSPSDNRIVRIKYDPAGDTLQTGTEQILVTGIARNKFHNGGRLRFSPDGQFLFAGTGDAQTGANAQNKNSLNGKVLRIFPDGTVPPDNPFGNQVWSMGHRNIQGLAFDSQGRLWEQEFGDSTQDETNLIVKGGNYGWPACEGTASHGTPGCATPGFIAPKHTYAVGVGSCSGITIIRDILYVACERGTSLYREQISGDSLINVTRNFIGTFAQGALPGRIRTVEPSPDGNMWLATSRDGDKDSIAHNSHNTIYKILLGT